MIYPPRTREEAERQRYGAWAGQPKGRAFDRTCCAYQVTATGGVLMCQCSRKPGHGPAELYCRQHAKKVLASD